MSKEDKKPTGSRAKKDTAASRKKVEKKAADKAVPVEKTPASKRLPAKKSANAARPAARSQAKLKEKAPAEFRFDAAEPFAGSSRVAVPAAPVSETVAVPETGPEDELSPLFKKLADPVLPDLPRENRARLQMQSPTRLYFYWSVKHNPFKTLSRAFGAATGNYTLVVRLINHTKGSEVIHAVDPEGNWWFSAEPDCVYRAEVGFYAPGRPFIRIIFSNFLRTPRRNPSPRTDYTPRFTVSADQFAEVLDASGYRRDAFEVALAGDDRAAADDATRAAYRKLFGGVFNGFEGSDGDELRFVLLALASGYSLEDLKGQINDALYESLIAFGARLSAEQALSALKENFDVETDEITEVEEIGPAVFGLSAVNFPRKIKSRTVPKKLLNKLSKFDTVSSSR